MSPKPYQISICVQYDEEMYTLAFVRFNRKGDVVVSAPTGDYQKLKSGVKFDPHATYHASGTHHLVTYSSARNLAGHIRHHHERKEQPLDASFSGWQNVASQSFNREFARNFGHICSGFDDSVVINAKDLREDWSDGISDYLGEIPGTYLATTQLQVDLIEPNRFELAQKTGVDPKTILLQRMIEQTFPWCLITIFDTGTS